MNPKELVERFIAAWNEHDSDAAAALLDPDFVYSTPGLANQGVDSLDKEGMLKRVWTMTQAAFPDCYVETTNIIIEGDQVVVEEIETGAMAKCHGIAGGHDSGNEPFLPGVPYAFFFEVNAKGLITSLCWGHRRVTIDELARRAGVGKGTI